jgi:hypothetical protein
LRKASNVPKSVSAEIRIRSSCAGRAKTSRYCSRGYESLCGLRIANPPQSKATKRCQPGTSRTTNNRKFPLADGLSRVAQCFANILDLKVRMSNQISGSAMPSLTMPTTVATGTVRH